jgi:hypothetical protein
MKLGQTEEAVRSQAVGGHHAGAGGRLRTVTWAEFRADAGDVADGWRCGNCDEAKVSEYKRNE